MRYVLQMKGGVAEFKTATGMYLRDDDWFDADNVHALAFTSREAAATRAAEWAARGATLEVVPIATSGNLS